ncbi:MAG TPA: NAD-glutamate dehydrogenase [Phycisphaerales bacterium]|nr:NAD-glutamate dehydrogenase [Phycisphaerales bacterium]HMP36470.1 NAD-glutamate dehydrogenase [Phycisphaerales bacterium]
MRATAPAPDSSHKARLLVDELTESLRETAQSVVPWFLGQMPRMYFQDTDHATQLSHLRAIIAAKASGRPLEMTLRSEDGSQWTAIRPANYPGVLAELVAALPTDRPLRSAKIHTAADSSLVLDTFEFGDRAAFDPTDPKQAEKVDETIDYVRRQGLDFDAAAIRDYASRCSGEYIQTVTPLRLCKHFELARQVGGSDGAVVALDQEADPTQSRITFVVGNARTRTMLERISTRLSRASINIHRAYLDVIDDPPHGTISILGFVVQTADGTQIDPSSALWREVHRDLRRIKWYDNRAIDLTGRHRWLDLPRADALVGLSMLVHQVLVRTNPYAFARERILSGVERFLPQGVAIVDLLAKRFDPGHPMSDADFEGTAGELAAEIDRTVGTEDIRTILHAMLRAVRATLRTNYHLPERFCFVLRLDPRFLVNEERPEVPWGVFFVHGREFNGFHARFQEIARGGLRVIRPATLEQHARETERLYDEVYGLAWAQQLKNKDIPEGGAKAAILLEPGADITRCVRAFVDGILDLITPETRVKSRIVDRLGHDELIYLGPDENITPAHIEWIVDRARRRGYGLPGAFMSSKPGAGINHKTYGVTSEGVNVFLEVALRAVGIDPRHQPFSVKITGGPDGDVAGNIIKILDRDYGANARIVAIADGSGCGEDPAGLDHSELLRLFREGLPIARFDRRHLHAGGRVVGVDDPDGVHLRNTMHNRVRADAFIPAGGRPSTIHERNYTDFLDVDGHPTSRVIVEGANIFITPAARKLLTESGALIIKDSSANKCGVITSSYEIAACMLIDEETFLAIKPVYVEQVLEKLRELARREAVLLMSERRRHPDFPLPEVSTELGRVINAAAAAIESRIDLWPEADRMLARQLVIDHLPPVLLSTVGDRLWSDLPAAYLRWLVAKSLASRIIYREGVEFLQKMPASAVGEIALEYLRTEVVTRQLVAEVADSSLPHRDRIAALLARGGTRAALAE